MMTRSFLYSGDVSPLFKQRFLGNKVYDSYSHMTITMAGVFEAQLLGERKFKGNVTVSAIIHMPFPDGMLLKRRQEKNGHYYTSSPTLAAMMRGLEIACADLLFDKDTVIVAMNIEKRWSVDPRLEMIISEVGSNGRKEEKKD